LFINVALALGLFHENLRRSAKSWLPPSGTSIDIPLVSKRSARTAIFVKEPVVDRRLPTIVALLTAMTAAVVILLGDVRPPVTTRSLVQSNASVPLPFSDALQAATTPESNDDHHGIESHVERRQAWALRVPSATPTNAGTWRAHPRKRSTVLRI
jgi:hypothetical protein